jgi:hypothetical protein
MKEPHGGRSKIFEWYRSLRMEHMIGLGGSIVFIAAVVFGVWYFLTLSERSIQELSEQTESVDE